MNTPNKLSVLSNPKMLEVLAYLEVWDVTELQEQDVRDLVWEYEIPAELQALAEEYLIGVYVPGGAK